MTRVERLRRKLLATDDASLFFERTALCAEGWQRHQWDPLTIQTARIFAHCLAHVSVIIDDDDLLVGRAAQIVPDAEQEGFLEENSHFDRTLGQWTLNQRVQDVFAAALSPREIEIMSVYGTGPGGWRNGHMTPDWPAVVGRGFKAIKEQARERRGQIRPDGPEDIRRLEFLSAVMISCDAIAQLARRYADAAGHMAAEAGNAGDHRRRRELLEIQQVCARVPEHPARSFREALQAVWLVQFALSAVGGARDFAPGRFDQYLRPFYERDLAAGSLTEEEARELIECFFIKLNENIGQGNKRSLCNNSVQYLIIGGVTPAGEDATNALSFMCLDAVERLRLKQPTVIVRAHDQTPPAFFRRVCEVIGEGTGNPSIFNDQTMIPALLSVGIPVEDARDYAVIGCANPNIPGREGALNDHRLNIVKCVELALNDGLCRMTGRDTGRRTGAAGSFHDFEALLGAFFHHLDELIAQWIKRNDLFEWVCASCACDPFLSSIVQGCIEQATDCYAGGATYFHTPYQAAGLATAADALAAVEVLVFEEEVMSLDELNQVLGDNFEGREDLRQRLRERYPRFGNDDDRVDQLARRIAQRFCRSVMRHPTRWGNGRGNWPGIYSFGQNHVHMGRETAATPDGRRAGDPISFNLSPSAGSARRGPTAVAQSVARLDFSQVSGGGTFDLKLDARSAADTDRLEALLRTYLELGGMQVQLNAVDGATLSEARARPEDYADLLVRVTGYSDYFTRLAPDVQEDIIARHEHALA